MLFDPDGNPVQRARLTPGATGTDRWHGKIRPTGTGLWTFHIEGWGDNYATWRHNAEVKIAAGVDVDLMLTEGRQLLEQAGGQGGRPEENARVLREAAAALADESLSVHERLAAGTSEAVLAAVRSHPIREPGQPLEAVPHPGGARKGRTRRLVRILPALGGRTSTTRRPASGPPGTSRRRPSGFRPSPPWALT